MINQIYTDHQKIQTIKQGPLGAYVDDLVTVLLKNGYSKAKLRLRFAVIGELNRWLIQKRIKLCDLDQLEIERFIQHRSKQTSMVFQGEMVTLNLLLDVLRSHGSIPTPEPEKIVQTEIEQTLEPYNQYMVQDRNYAILLLLARLGLRVCEVVRLTLDDIDWEHGEIVIRGKGGRQTRFPLPMDVGEALVAYLKNGRPSCSTRRFFICSRPPLKPLGNSSTVSSIVHRCIKRAGLNPPKKGAHLLRHTLGTECLRNGATLPEVGEILRHRQVDTTAIYAKVDFARLETIAQPWPDKSMAGGVL